MAEPLDGGVGEMPVPENIRTSVNYAITKGPLTPKQQATAFTKSHNATKLKELQSLIRTLERKGCDCGEAKKKIVAIDGVCEPIDGAPTSEGNIDRHLTDAIVNKLGDSDTPKTIPLKIPMSPDLACEYANAITHSTGRMVFIAPDNMQVRGKITNVEWQGKRKVPMMFVCHRNDDDQGEIRHSFMFYERFDRRVWVVDYVFEEDVYGYRFFGENNHEYLILSPTEINSEEMVCTVSGFGIDLRGAVDLKDDVKLGVYKTVIRVRNIIREEQGKKYDIYISSCPPPVLGKKVEVLKVLFSKYRHPEYFEKFILSWLLSSKDDGYPLHLFIFQEGGGGKTTMMESVCDALGLEKNSIWEGNQSTPLSLGPTFNTTPPDCGWMSQQRVIGFLDEFLGRLGERKKGETLADYDILKSLLEHKNRMGRSGKGTVNVNVTAKFLFSSNQRYGISDVESFMRRTDPAFVERLLVYVMNNQHKEYINERKELVKYEKATKSTIPPDVLHDLIAACSSFSIEGIDYTRVGSIIRESIRGLNIYDSVKNEAIKTYTEARMLHHGICLLDGYVKSRVLEKNPSGLLNEKYRGTPHPGSEEKYLRPMKCDYEELESILPILARSWVDENFHISDYSKKAREGFLGYPAKDLYAYINENKGKVDESDLLTFAVNQMKLTNDVYLSTKKTLVDWGLVVFDKLTVYTHWRDDCPKPDQKDPDSAGSNGDGERVMTKTLSPQAPQQAVRALDAFNMDNFTISDILSTTGQSEEEILPVIEMLKEKGRIIEWKPGMFKKAD